MNLKVDTLYFALFVKTLWKKKQSKTADLMSSSEDDRSWSEEVEQNGQEVHLSSWDALWTLRNVEGERRVEA